MGGSKGGGALQRTHLRRARNSNNCAFREAGLLDQSPVLSVRGNTWA